MEVRTKKTQFILGVLNIDEDDCITVKYDGKGLCRCGLASSPDKLCKYMCMYNFFFKCARTLCWRRVFCFAAPSSTYIWYMARYSAYMRRVHSTVFSSIFIFCLGVRRRLQYYIKHIWIYVLLSIYEYRYEYIHES